MSRRRTIVLLALALAAAGILAHAPALRNGFTNLDDPQILLENPDVRGLSGAHLLRLFGTSYGGLGGYTPLVLASYAIEYRFFGLNPRVFHATNLLLHVANTLLVFWLLGLVGGRLGVSFAVALIFAVHPLHVEPVAWIQGRKDLLFSFFLLAGLLVYARNILDRRRGHGALALALFALAAFSKMAAVSFPLVLLLVERRLAGRIDRRAVLRTIPFWIVAGVIVALAFLTHDPLLGRSAGPMPGPLESIGRFFYAFAFYAKRVVWPFGLMPGYLGRFGFPPAETIAAVTVLAGLVVALALAHRRRPDDVTFGVGLAVLTLLPTLPFHLFGQPYEDRYMYLPLAGVLFALAGLSPPAVSAGRRPARRAALGGGLLLLVAAGLTFRSRDQARVWSDSLTLWDHTIAVEPENPMGHLNRAETLFQQGRFAEAVAGYDQARRLLPDDPRPWLGLASAHFRMGEPKQALQELDRALELDPLYYDAYIARGLFWGNIKAFENAVRDFSAALAINKTEEAFYYRGLAYVELAQHDRAVEDLRAAYRMRPSADLAARIAELSKMRSP